MHCPSPGKAGRLERMTQRSHSPRNIDKIGSPSSLTLNVQLMRLYLRLSIVHSTRSNCLEKQSTPPTLSEKYAPEAVDGERQARDNRLWLKRASKYSDVTGNIVAHVAGPGGDVCLRRRGTAFLVLMSFWIALYGRTIYMAQINPFFKLEGYSSSSRINVALPEAAR